MKKHTFLKRGTRATYDPRQSIRNSRSAQKQKSASKENRTLQPVPPRVQAPAILKKPSPKTVPKPEEKPYIEIDSIQICKENFNVDLTVVDETPASDSILEFQKLEKQC